METQVEDASNSSLSDKHASDLEKADHGTIL